MIAVADVNTIWRAKPFEALSAMTPVLGLAPQDLLAAWRLRAGRSSNSVAAKFGKPVLMPPGWASRWQKWTGKRLWSLVQQHTQNQIGSLHGLVVTSLHYVELVKLASPHLATFYYCSDDYTQYEGWGGETVIKKEAQLVRSVNHAFFVSQVLADRAVHEYGISADRVSVSPNATDAKGLDAVDEQQMGDLFHAFPTLRRPLVGVVGGINDRLDFDLIASCADLAETGSLVLVGSVDKAFKSEGLTRLLSHPKCVFAGQQPHDKIPVWMQALDVALIPYRDTLLNRACSPMRLYDHLAAGKPVVATDCCDQVSSFHEMIHIKGQKDSFVQQVAEMICREACPGARLPAMLKAAGEHTWDVRARRLAAAFSKNMA
ncbi:glycosyltransferase [Prosthecobacter sp. SYSU 5D2]|uniref:glycosyltransferase n=1 Tax=Prosthecobacter sp. SYSU 5D2 TaxID=3134134 RepID=UPI0031FE901C